MKRIISLMLFCAVLAFSACSKQDPEDNPIVNPDPGQDPGKDPEQPVGPGGGESVFPTKGEHQYLVILVETSDVHFSIPDPNQAFWDMLNKKDYSDYGGTGSARDYFMAQSSSAFIPQFDVFGPVEVEMQMSNFTANYGLGKIGAARLFSMACDKIDDQVDFSKYDSDNNGEIDNIFFYFAGYNSADGPDNAIWPHAGKVEYKEWEFDGKKFIDYACTSELKGASGTDMARIGNFCHEFSHILGLPDFYDTQYGKAEGPKDYSLMHSGCYNNSGNTPPSFNCEERLMLGWMDEIPSIDCTTASHSLGPVSKNSACLLETDNPGEYFCFEYRDGTGWDASLPKGLVIYHVDKSKNDVHGKTADYRWRYQYDINGYADHECFDLIEADGTCSSFGNGVNSFVPVAWDGRTLGFYLDNITINDSGVTFDILPTE